MAKIKVKGLEKLTKLLRTEFTIEVNKIFSNKSVLAEVRKIVKENFLAKDFKAAETNTIKFRDYVARYNTLSEFYKRERVKAILSGQLLDDLIKGTVGAPTNRQFIIAHTENGVHKGYKKKSGGNTKSINMDELSGYLINDMELNYISLSDENEQKIIKLIKKEIENIVDRLNR